ncbi:Cell wall integrity protein scw1 [Psilocybe cubensis]|uniref:RRM domain-containing protein n=2 Tax=Psilocybe cubensis TaxID=181762 RepID=A0A8H8CKP1_PSICU|nr:Cell wall integrity protein scw1 [Psilocybe cubensis]KAH9482348.1 Cell wall integrity protein scw1 [Psilocybe cubensis]
MPALPHPDEDFINKSLLAIVDAQADAEPVDDHRQSDADAPQMSFFPQSSKHFRNSFTSFPNTTRHRHSFYPDVQYDTRATYDYKNYLPEPYNPKQFQGPFPNQVQLSSQTPYGPHVPAAPQSTSGAAITPNAPLPIQSATNPSANGEEISTIFVVGFPEDMQEREFQNMFTFSAGFEAATLKIPNKEYTAYGSLVPGPQGPTLANGMGLRAPTAFPYPGPNDPYNMVTVNPAGVVVDGGRDGGMSSWGGPQSVDDLANSHYLGAGPGGAAALGLGPLGLGATAMTGGTSLTLPPRKQIIGFAKFRTRDEALAARDVLQGRRVDIEKGAVLKAEMAKKNLHTKRGVGPVPGAGIGVQPVVQQQQSQQQQQHINGLSVTGMDTFNNDSAGFGASSNRDSLSGLARLGWRDQGQLDPANPLQSNGAHVNGRDDEDRKRDSLLSMGLGGLSLASNANATGQRGPRERAEDEEWRRKEKEQKEMNLMRLRASNAAAFDAFHGVPASAATNATNANGAPGMSRQSSTASTSSGSVVGGGPASSNSGLWTAAPSASTVPTESVAASSPMLADAEAENREGDEAKQQQAEDEVVGPWDRFNKPTSASYAAVARPSYSTNGQHHPTESERSTSPTPYQENTQQYQTPAQYQPQFLHLHEQQQAAAAAAAAATQQHLFDQPHQHLYQSMYSQQQHFRSSQSESSETGSVVGADSSPSTSNNPNMNPIGYVGARLGYSTGFGNASTSSAREPVSVAPSVSSSSGGASIAKSPSTGFNFGSMLHSTRGSLNGGSASAVSPPPIVPLSSSAGVDASVTAPTSMSIPTSAQNTNTSANASVAANGVIGAPAMSSGSSSNGGSASGSVNGSGGNTSPQLPSPAGSGMSTGSSSAQAPGSTTHVRGTVDQNPPINTLYVGNLPTSPLPLGYSNDYLEETLRALFSACAGFRKLCFRQKANGPMCFIEFVDVQQATDALKTMSGNTLGGIVKNGIRLSFSKNPLGVRTPTSAGGNNGGPTLQQQQQLVQTLSNHNHGSNNHNGHPLHHHQFNHNQQHQPQQQQMGPPPPSGSSETFQARLGEESQQQQPPQQHRLPPGILRRDSTLSPTTMSSLAQAQAQSPSYMNGNGSANSFFSSPPPRFYTTSPPGLSFGGGGSGSSSTPLTGASSAFIPRAAQSATAAAGAGAGGFSPFGITSFAAAAAVGSSVFVPQQQQQQMPHLPQLSIPGDQHQPDS